jgi:hypothetical protein
MNEIAKKTLKYTAVKKCKSENQVKGDVKAKTITKQHLPYLQLKTLFKMSFLISNTRLWPVPFDVQDGPDITC